jgi:AcrR family transcriptional regulator
MAGAKRDGRKRDGRSKTTTAAGGVRERLLDAAIAILRESGVQRLTQVQVAERAGVRQSHLTYYFPTREDLLEALTARAVEGIAHGAGHNTVGGGGGEREGVGHGPLLERLAAAEVELGHMRMFLGLIVEADGDPAVRDMLVRGTQHIEGVIAESLGGDDAKERARVVLAALWGLGLYQFLVRPPPKSDPTRSYLSWLATAAAGEAPRQRGTARGRRAPPTRE